MNRKQREAAKARQEAIKQARSVAQAKLVAERAQREAAIDSAYQRADRAARPRIRGPKIALIDAIRAKAPRLADSAAGFGAAVDRLAKLDRIRTIDTWAPRGKGRNTLFRSLAQHLLALYPVPAILWNAFHDDNANVLVPLAAHVARGGSFYDYAQASLPIPLTRKMCHDVLTTPAEYKLIDAIRRAQARAAGVDRRLYDAWRTVRFVQDIGTKDSETFWYSVLSWFAKTPMIELGEVSPLCDYILSRRNADPSFTIKGRSGLAMLRAMREWHGSLTKERVVSSAVFASSGLRSADFIEHRREKDVLVKELWQVEEILTARALADEGNRMGHCVYSYAWRIEKGDTSIWSVKMEDGRGETGRWHMVTLEVRNDLRRVVQARGRYNRSMTPKELRIVTRWAGMNDLAVTLGAW